MDLLSCRDGGGNHCVCLLFVFWGRMGARWQRAALLVAFVWGLLFMYFSDSFSTEFYPTSASNSHPSNWSFVSF